MDWTALSNLSPGVAVGALCVYFFNNLVLRYLDERKEMIAGIIAERKEWAEEQQRLLNRYDARMVAAIEAQSNNASQIHALKNVITGLTLKFEAWLSKGTAGDD